MRYLLPALLVLAASALAQVPPAITPECNPQAGCAFANPPTTAEVQAACNSEIWQELQSLGAPIQQAQAASCTGDFPGAREKLTQALAVMFANMQDPNTIQSAAERANQLFVLLASIFRSTNS